MNFLVISSLDHQLGEKSHSLSTQGLSEFAEVKGTLVIFLRAIFSLLTYN